MKFTTLICILSMLYMAWHCGIWFESTRAGVGDVPGVISMEIYYKGMELLTTHSRKPDRYTKLDGDFTITAYCAEPYAYICNDGDSTCTATGTKPTPWRTIAVDPSVIPLGSKIYIDGLGVYIAEDTGTAINGNDIDILMESHNDALEFGRQEKKVWILIKGGQ